MSHHEVGIVNRLVMQNDEETKDHGASLLPADPSAVVQTEPLPTAERVRDGWRGLAAWMRAPGTINREDAIDECARAVQNYADYQFQLAAPDGAETEPRPNSTHTVGSARAAVWDAIIEWGDVEFSAEKERDAINDALDVLIQTVSGSVTDSREAERAAPTGRSEAQK